MKVKELIYTSCNTINTIRIYANYDEDKEDYMHSNVYTAAVMIPADIKNSNVNSWLWEDDTLCIDTDYYYKHPIKDIIDELGKINLCPKLLGRSGENVY